MPQQGYEVKMEFEEPIAVYEWECSSRSVRGAIDDTFGVLRQEGVEYDGRPLTVTVKPITWPRKLKKLEPKSDG